MDHAKMVEEISEVASDILSEWECEFIENVQGKKFFSDKQRAVIERLYEKVCEGPY